MHEKIFTRLIFWGNIFLIFTLYLVGIAGILTLGWHWIAPESLHFANAEQTGTIKQLFTGIGLYYLVKDFYNKKLFN